MNYRGFGAGAFAAECGQGHTATKVCLAPSGDFSLGETVRFCQAVLPNLSPTWSAGLSQGLSLAISAFRAVSDALGANIIATPW